MVHGDAATSALAQSNELEDCNWVDLTELAECTGCDHGILSAVQRKQARALERERNGEHGGAESTYDLPQSGLSD